jgi:hemerythrin-like domain-containing protein
MTEENTVEFVVKGIASAQKELNRCNTVLEDQESLIETWKKKHGDATGKLQCYLMLFKKMTNEHFDFETLVKKPTKKEIKEVIPKPKKEKKKKSKKKKSKKVVEAKTAKFPKKAGKKQKSTSSGKDGK